jgi:CRISPR-associated protein Cas1
VIVEGFGVSVRIERGRLLLRDGFGRSRRERSYSRVQAREISRLVILGHGGTISLESIGWLANLGIPLLHVDPAGRVLTTSSANSADARLRRAQALAPTNENGLEIARHLLGEKLRGQEGVLENLTHDPAALKAIAEARRGLEEGTTLNELMLAERDGALVYWRCFEGLVIHFRDRDLARVPERWRRFQTRSSPLTSSPRSAVDPFNASLNLAYALAEAQARIALLAVGLDPDIAVLHADVRGRASLALDVLEAVRPEVDAYVLGLVRQRTFSADHFHETRQGVCRLLPPLTHELAETLPTWADQVAPVAERVSAMLANAPGSRVDRMPTPLTSANRRAARDAVRRHPPARTKTLKPSLRCRRCGEEVPRRDRVYCDDCLPHYQREQYATAFHGSGLRAIERVRTDGDDPTHGAEAAAARASTNIERKREAREWDERYGKLTDLSAFQREILPLIQSVPLSRLQQATGLSLRYVSLIRRSERTPHPRHWEAFRQAAKPVTSVQARDERSIRQ